MKTLEEARAIYAQGPDPMEQDAYDYLPGWLRRHLPELYEQHYAGDDTVVWVKYFLPEGRLTFYVTEYSEVAPDGYPHLFFGYVLSPITPDFDELGYFTFAQISEIRSPVLQLPIERDLYWTPKTLKEVRDAAF